MSTIYHANITITERDAAGHATQFAAEMRRHPNPWTPDDEHEYQLTGTMVHGIIESLAVPGANDAELAAIQDAYRLLPVHVREGWGDGENLDGNGEAIA